MLLVSAQMHRGRCMQPDRDLQQAETGCPEVPLNSRARSAGHFPESGGRLLVQRAALKSCSVLIRAGSY